MKITNHVLKRYVTLKKHEKDIAEELEYIRKEILKTGGIQTKEYIAIVSEIEKPCLAPVSEFIKNFGEEKLRNQYLLYNVTYNQLKVSHKP